MFFRKWGCLVGLKKSIFRKLKSIDPKKNAFDHGNQFTLLFSLQSISGKWERERESVRACERRSVGRRDRAVDRDLAVARSRRIVIVINGERGRSEIAINASRDRAVDRDLAKKARSRLPVVVDDFFLGCGLCFSRFVFSFFFFKHQKIFSGKFFEMQPNTEKYFPFPEISIFGKYVFSGKYFTATKHSLSPLNFYSYLS